MNILEHPYIIENMLKAPSYSKSSSTLLRLAKEEEKGIQFNTYVKDENSYRKESSNIISNNIIARNSEVIGRDNNGTDIYNEWLISISVAEKNYGADILQKLLSSEFTAHNKINSLKAIEITKELLDKLNIAETILEITVDWSDEPMIAHIGDYLTDGGYSISKHDMTCYQLLDK